MRRGAFAWAALISSLLASQAAGHGGLYRGPGPVVPPMPVPGGSPGSGAPTPGGGGPKTPGGGGALTMTKKAPATDHTNWTTWWDFNREPFLNLRERLGSQVAVTGGADASVRPTFSELEDSVVPALLRLLSEDDPDIVDSAVLAVARITPVERAAAVYESIVETLGHRERSVKESAILALGVLGDPRAVEPLIQILADGGAGRKLLGQTRACDVVQRGMAAVALGMIADEKAIEPLIHAYRRADDAELDLRAAIVMAMGLFEGAPYEAIQFLREVLGSRRTNDVIVAQAPIALSRLGPAARPLLPELLDLVRSRKTGNPIRQSAVVALGKLSAPDDREVFDALLTAVARDTDDGVANFAWIALGEAGARVARDPDRHAELLHELNRAILRRVTRPKKRSQLPFAATAGALVARAYPAGHRQREVYEDKLTEAFHATRRPDHRAALAISLALMEATGAAGDLLEAFEQSNDRELNGYLAEALGLMRYAAAAEALRKDIEDDSDARYRIRLAEGLGLMGDPEVSDRLVEELRSAGTLWVTASVAKAIGRVGDRGAVKPLSELAADRRRASLSRAFGAVGIGLLAEKTPLPWNAHLRVGSNYLAAFHVQTQVLDIL